LAIEKFPPYFGLYVKACVSNRTFFATPMLFALCWSSPYDFKMLMKDFKWFLSQFGSSDMLAKF
jgi:hypothetical protein